MLDLSGRFGSCPQQHLELGGFADVASTFDACSHYGLGGFAERHVPTLVLLQGRAIPDAGADLGLACVDTSLGDENAALILRPRIGLTWFIRGYFALDTQVFVAVATDDLFSQKRTDLDPYDGGLRLGLRISCRYREG